MRTGFGYQPSTIALSKDGTMLLRTDRCNSCGNEWGILITLLTDHETKFLEPTHDNVDGIHAERASGAEAEDVIGGSSTSQDSSTCTTTDTEPSGTYVE